MTYRKAEPLASLFCKHDRHIALATLSVALILAELALLPGAPAPVQAAPTQQTQTPSRTPAQPPRKKYNNDNEFVPEKLKDPPDLPFLPPYPNAVYSNILNFNRQPNKPAFTLTFHVKETPDQVINWYKDAFKSNKWGKFKGGDSEKMASGTRIGATACVSVMKPILKGYKAQVYLVYKVHGKIPL